jgi:hypothetical protein
MGIIFLFPFHFPEYLFFALRKQTVSKKWREKAGGKRLKKGANFPLTYHVLWI